MSVKQDTMKLLPLLFTAAAVDAVAIVNTTSGRFAPLVAPSHPRVLSYLDIPYAQPPLGDLRFAPPVAATPPANNSVQLKTKLPLGCIQYLPAYLSGSVATEAGDKAALFQRGDYANTTEDCLRLSIFAPNTPQNKLPIVVWVHGGGYVFGGTNVPYQLAPNWVEQSQRHIVVQIQYRLNLFGLPNAAGLVVDGKNLNLAFLDQRRAIEWVRDNAVSFGGDPSRITLWGESAGAYSVDGYLYAFKEDPIVAGAIADSGNALLIDSVTSSTVNTTQFTAIAERFGCKSGDPRTELACMRQVDEKNLKEYLQAPVGAKGAADDGLSFTTVVDNVTVLSNYADLTTRGQFARTVPLLIGTNTDEGNAVVPYNFPGSETATSLPSNLQSIADGFGYNLHCSTIHQVRLRAANDAPTWQYLYAGNFSDISPRPWLGAYHVAELPLVFGTFGLECSTSKFEGQVSRYMQDSWLAFIEDPVHGLERRGWSSGKTGEMMKIAGERVSEVVSSANLQDVCRKRGQAV